MTDNKNRPLHYINHPSGVECIQITEHMNFCIGNAIEYLWWAGLKDDAIEDLKKAEYYVKREIERREKIPQEKLQCNFQKDDIQKDDIQTIENLAADPGHELIEYDATDLKTKTLCPYIGGMWVGSKLGCLKCKYFKDSSFQYASEKRGYKSYVKCSYKKDHEK